MILYAALILSIAIALLRGGSLKALAQVSFAHGWVAILAFALQLIEIYAPLPKTEGLLGRRTLLLLGSYGALILVVGLNYRLVGLPIIGAGLALNLLVMVVNGGYMPITLEALERAGLSHLALGSEAGSRLLATKDILLARQDTVLWFLSDIWVLPPPIGTVLSIGDILLAVGAFMFFQRMMVPASTGLTTSGEQGAS